MDEKKQKKTEIVRVDPALHAEIDAESARLKLFMYEVVARAWQSYKHARDHTPPRGEKIPAELQRYMDMLADVLESPEADIIDGVARNLDLFHELLRRRIRKPD